MSTTTIDPTDLDLLAEEPTVTGCYRAGWIDPNGKLHAVPSHSRLHVDIDGQEIRGYDAFEHGWLRIYAMPRPNDTREMGLEARKYPLTPSQAMFVTTFALAKNVRTVYADGLGLDGGFTINHGENVAPDLRQRFADLIAVYASQA